MSRGIIIDTRDEDQILKICGANKEEKVTEENIKSQKQHLSLATQKDRNKWEMLWEFWGKITSSQEHLSPAKVSIKSSMRVE